MCGILLHFGEPVNLPSFKQALQLQNHRGPDSTEILSVDNVIFGFKRLAILDLTDRSNQPIEFGDIVIVFNGELYNYKQLREELKSLGLRFNSEGDAEVMAAAISYWGHEEACRRARGMWGLVAYHKKSKLLYVSRDRFGIKPLWIARHQGNLIISSEIKSIIALYPALSAKDERTIAGYFAYSHLDNQDRTFYKHIKPFPAAHMAVVRSGQELDFKSYWELGYTGSGQVEQDEIYQILTETMEQHLQSDVPVGLALSGGLDSTILAHFAKRKGALECFSIQHPSADYESPLIEETVRKWNLNHSFIPCSWVENFDSIQYLIEKMDQPFKAAQTLYQYALRKEAANRGIRVFLTGDGADEVFGGYVKCVTPLLIGLLRRFKLYEFFTHAGNLSAFSGSSPTLLVYSALTTYISRVLRKSSVGMAPYLNVEMEELAGNGEIGSLKQENSLKEFLRNRLVTDPIPYWLRVEDGISMSESMETRVPFLDHVLVEKALQFPEEMFMRGGRNKAFLRTSMDEYLPQHIKAPRIKYQRPGNSSRLIFEILHKEAAEVIDDLRKENYLTVGVEQFQKDRELNRNGSFWFRAFLFQIWNKRKVEVS